MKKKTKLLLPLSILSILALVGCTPSNSNSNTSGDNEDYGSPYDYNDPIVVEDPTEVVVDENTDEFSLETTDGEYSKNGNIYSITKGGTYTASGKLEGQILIEAGDDDEVVLELNDVSISYDQDSPIKAVSGSKLEISAKKNTGNTVTDNRNKKTTDIDSQGEGAISSDIDLKLKGTGTLVVVGNYNNGVHTTKDLKIQKLTLKSTGYNNAIKGKNSVTIESGEVQVYALTGNGIKTEDSDLSSKGKQRGTISITGGTVYVDSLHDGIDAAYNVEVSQADNEVPTSITVKTGKKATVYSSSTFKADSEKGLKAANDIIVNGGTIVISSSDDAIHANYGTALDNGSKGTGNITVNDGLIQVAAGDDGFHADNTLAVKGGKVVVTGAKEGFEANYINISGGYSYIYGTDDGVNCSKKSFNNCKFTMTGGYLDVAVSSGDTDGIDSNGDVEITGGVIISRGSPGTQGSRMSTGLDVDVTCTMSGGTLIAFNGLEKAPSTSSNVLFAGTTTAGTGGPGGGGGPGGPGGWHAYGGSSSSSYTFSAGEYTLTGGDLDISFTNDYVYGSFMIYSSGLVSGTSYTLNRGSTTVLSWTQSSSSQTIS